MKSRVKNRPILLYHWSPTSRRKSILKYGLVPLKKSSHIKGWRPPYICFAKYPTVAWALSAHSHAESPGSWDLWCVWSDRTQYKTLNVNNRWWMTEYRVNKPIPKRLLWMVGTRQFKSRRHG